MTMHAFEIDEKLEAVESIIRQLRELGFRKDVDSRIFLDKLKAVAADLNARQELPRGHALGTLRRAMRALRDSKTSLGYDQIRLMAVANVVVQHWATIEQALELWGEETAE